MARLDRPPELGAYELLSGEAARSPHYGEYSPRGALVVAAQTAPRF